MAAWTNHFENPTSHSAICQSDISAILHVNTCAIVKCSERHSQNELGLRTRRSMDQFQCGLNH